MSVVVPNSSEVIILQYITNNDAPENISMRLYANDITPNDGSTTASFIEVIEGGYAVRSLSPNGWTIVSGTPSQASYAELTWSFTGPVGNVYGYYVTRDTGGEVLWAERFTTGPFNVKTAGDEIKVLPRLTLRQRDHNDEII